MESLKPEGSVKRGGHLSSLFQGVVPELLPLITEGRTHSGHGWQELPSAILQPRS